MKKILVSFVAMMFLFVCLVGNLYAVPCASGSMTGSTECTDVSGNDSAAAMNNFNSGAGVFGINTWEFKTKTDETPTSYGLKSTPMTSGNSGTWEFSSTVWDDWSYVSLVIKAGNAFSAYLMNNVSMPTSGDWTATGSELSHLTLYVANKKEQVPEPATLLLFGAGIAGLALYRRKRS